MIVFGKARESVSCAVMLERIRTHLEAADAAEVGIERHGRLAAALIEAGALAQGLLDAEFAARGEADGRGPAGEAAMALVVRLAGRLARSWRNRFASEGSALASLAAARFPRLPDRIEVATPEGFAFYAVYPEAYLAGAARLPEGEDWRVVGIRSIGTTLAATVAAALGTGSPVTVRPVGPPFARRVALSAGLVREIEAEPEVRYVVVDEGPGLSGSSLGATVRALETCGVAPDRVHLMPSHGNPPGQQATAENGAAWDRASRHVATFDDIATGDCPREHRVESWFRDLVGEAVAPLRDLSGGGWRTLVARPGRIDPPVQPWLERRKFLLETAGGSWLLKFAGLGAVGLRKLDRARALAEAGFSPQPAGWRHGFLAEPWLDAQDIDGALAQDRTRVLKQIAEYLGFRARHFPAPRARGASFDGLLAMASHNLDEALGAASARRLGGLAARAERLQGRVRPIEIDGRLHPWEWRVAGGRIWKTDALDHHCGHDLVGCQDVAWDIAGAAVEFDLSPAEAGDLAAAVERESGHPIDPDLVGLLLPCYLAFQLGAWTLAGGGGPDRASTQALIARYVARLDGSGSDVVTNP